MIVKTKGEMEFAKDRLLENCVMCGCKILSEKELSDKSCDPLCISCEKEQNL